MKIQIKNTIGLLGLLLAFTCQLCAADQLITADNPHYQYTGRVDFSNPAAPVISWPGTAVSTVFTGTGVAVMLDDQQGKNYFNVFINEDWDNPVVIAAKAGEHVYPVVSGLPAGSHKLTLFKRTEGEEGSTLFKGLVLADDQRLEAPARRPSRKIEFFGDSITSGAGNEAPLGDKDDNLAEKNHFLTYAAITARALSAEHHTTSQSGIGIMVSWFDFTMPDFYDQLNAVGNNDSRWDFSQWTPDVVVINLFQNDSWLVDKRLSPVPSTEARIQAYIDFVNRIRRVYPEATLICALGSMDATQQGSPWPGYVEQAVERIKKSSDDQKIHTFFFPFTGYAKHPRVIHHQENARLLTEFIRNTMQW